MTEVRRHVAFCGGGSGGHLSPAIAVAEKLADTDEPVDITFVTSQRSVDGDMLTTLNVMSGGRIRHQTLPVTGRNRIAYLFRLPLAVMTCWRSFRKHAPCVVIGTGGFASIPGVLAAALLRIPIGLVELNRVPGRANRLLSRLAAITFVGWPLREEYHSQWKTSINVVGIPLRQNFLKSCSEHNRSTPDSGHKHVLVIGGSQGASGLNDLVQKALEAGQPLPTHWHIVHQTGHRDEARIRQGYGQATNVEVRPFIRNMAEALRTADLVVSRAGAVALAEIAAVGTPAILVPLPGSADQHQQANAEFLSRNAETTVINQTNAAAKDQLRRAIDQILGDDGTAEHLRRRLNAVAKLTAVDEITQWIGDTAPS